MKKGSILEKDILWLIDWYQFYCCNNPELESQFVIVGIDNPGWGLKVNLSNTPYKDESFEPIFEDRSEIDWRSYEIKNNIFSCAGGPFYLPDMLKTFRTWIQATQTSDGLKDRLANKPLTDRAQAFINDKPMTWLTNWFFEHCDGDWEHHHIICLRIMANATWEVQFSLSETVLDGQNFETVDLKRSDTDWVQCEVISHRFYGYGGLFNLPEILHCLIFWANPIIAGTID